MTTLKGKVALITGSARGVGRAIAERYASLGADIVINYSRDKTSAEDTQKAIEKFGVKTLLVQADVSKVAELEQMFSDTLAAFGKIDIVVANAGIEIVDQSALDFTEEEFDKLFGINSKGAFFTLQQAAKHVADHGRIIYIGSSTTAFPLPGVALYGGSKMAPRFLVEVLAKELGKKGIAVNSIIPTALAGAGVFTNMEEDAPIKKLMEDSFCPMGRMGAPEDVANVAEFFASDLSAFVSGQHLLISGGGPC